MPQMSPMDWLILMIFFIFIYLLFLVNIYFMLKFNLLNKIFNKNINILNYKNLIF